LAFFLFRWQPALFGAPSVAGDPRGRSVVAQPGGGNGGQDLQGVAHRLDHQLEAIERADGPKDVGGVSPLPAARLEQPLFTEARQEQTQ
jgi:hypothetical protein